MVSLIPAGRIVSLTPWHWIALQDGQGQFLSTLEVFQKQGCGTWGHHSVLNVAVLGSLLGSVVLEGFSNLNSIIPSSEETIWLQRNQHWATQAGKVFENKANYRQIFSSEHYLYIFVVLYLLIPAAGEGRLNPSLFGDGGMEEYLEDLGLILAALSHHFHLL